ncbi:MAG: type II toxin-antitoxin system VapC family toxin [Thermosynechococcaceae cyanobacterium]
MSRFVLDCSVSLSWCFEDEANPYADSVLDALQDSSALVPSLWAFEAANALLVAERRNRISSAQSIRAIALLQALPIFTDEVSPHQSMTATLSLARSHGLSAYDAAYLELALREGLALATLDKRLELAAQGCGVILFAPV